MRNLNLANLGLAINDTSAKLILQKSYTVLLGLKSSILLQHLCNTLENDFRVISLSKDGKWHKQNLEWMGWQTSLTRSSLLRARKKLIDENLIEIRHLSSIDRTTLWRVNAEKVGRFSIFAHFLRFAIRPDNQYTFSRWEEFYRDNPDIVNEFKHLYCDFDKLEKVSLKSQSAEINAKEQLEDMELGEVIIKRKAPVSDGKNEDSPKKQAEVVKEAPKKQGQATKPEKPKNKFRYEPLKNDAAPPKKEPEKNRFVEYWNTLPHVPKCRIGTKSYKNASAFFEAHRKYCAGQKEFVLTKDEQARIKLEKTNLIPPDAKKVGNKQIAVRSDEQMYQHIRRAALVYDPAYFPANKLYLPKTLIAFLYNAFSKKYGQVSMFLEKVGRAPKELEEYTFESLEENATEDEIEVSDALQGLYNIANGRSEDEPLDLGEFKKSLEIARAFLEEHEKIPMDVHIFANHFFDYRGLLAWWTRFAEDNLWKGMPMNAFAIGKDLWRKFIANASEDIGYNLYTGNRV